MSMGCHEDAVIIYEKKGGAKEGGCRGSGDQGITVAVVSKHCQSIQFWNSQYQGSFMLTAPLRCPCFTNNLSGIINLKMLIMFVHCQIFCTAISPLIAICRICIHVHCRGSKMGDSLLLSARLFGSSHPANGSEWLRLLASASWRAFVILIC